MFVVTVHLKIVPEKVAEFRPVASQHARNSLTKEPGCQRFDVSFDPANESQVFIYELYSDEAAFQAHASSEHFNWFKETAGPWIAEQQLNTWQLAGG